MWTRSDIDSQERDLDVAPSAAIAMKLSDRLEKDVTDIEPIGNTIDTDALNRLVERSASTELRFEFTHEDCRIELDCSEISVSELDEASD